MSIISESVSEVPVPQEFDPELADKQVIPGATQAPPVREQEVEMNEIQVDVLSETKSARIADSAIVEDLKVSNIRIDSSPAQSAKSPDHPDPEAEQPEESEYPPVDEAEISRIINPEGAPVDLQTQVKKKPPTSRKSSQNLISSDDQRISYKSLRYHIDHNHPTKLDPERGRQVPFKLCDSLGRLHVFHCCQKCCPQEVTEMARQLGAGPSLFLMSVKSMATLFLVLTIINLPVMWVFQSGSRIEREYPMMKPTWSDRFSQYSLGNIGRTEKMCIASHQFPQERAYNRLFNPEEVYDEDLTMELKCPEDEYIEIYEIGLVTDSYICNKITSEDFEGGTDEFYDALEEVFVHQDWGCRYFYQTARNQTNATALEQLHMEMDKMCVDKEQCEYSIDKYMSIAFDLPYSYCREDVKQSFGNLTKNAPVSMVVIGNCRGENLQDREYVSEIMMIADVCTVGAILLFVWFLDNSSRKYAKQFANQTLEMNDFAIRVKPMPHQSKYFQNDEVLRAHLVAHFQAVAKDQYLAERVKEAKMEGQEATPESIEQELEEQMAENPLKPIPWEVADVCFGKREMGEMLYLEKLTSIRNEFLKMKIKIQRAQFFKEKMKYAIGQQTLKKMFQFVKEKHLALLEENATESEDPEIRYAYVTFRDMRATDLVLKAYEVGWCKRKCALSCFGSCFKASKPGLLKKHFFSEWPRLNRACLPEYIKPENLSYTAKERNLRWAITWLVALAIIIVTISGIIMMKNIADDLKSEYERYPTKLQCPKLETTPIEEQTSDCRCTIWVTQNKWDLIYDDLHCHKYAGKYIGLNIISIVTAAVVAIINIVSCVIFEKLAAFEKNHTTNDETKSSFFKIALLQYINISIVILIVNFGFLSDPKFNYIPLFKGEHNDFSISWYTQVGKTLGITLFMQMFTPHASKIAKPLILIYLRHKDRGGQSHLKIKDAKDDQDVNTQLLLQDEINELYTGTQISIQYVLAQTYTYFWCVLTFSTGMPLLYLLGFAFFAIFYWVYKFLLLRFHARSSQFSEDLPIQSVGLIKYGVLLHLICGCQMITYLFEKLQKPSKDQSASSIFSQLLDRYIDNDVGEIYTLMLIGFLFALFFRHTILSLLYRAGKACIRFCQKKRGVLVSKDQEEYSADIYKDLQLSFLESLYLKACLERERFEKVGEAAMSEGATAQFRRQEEVIATTKEHAAYLDRRVSQIEAVVDDHILALHGPRGLTAMSTEHQMDTGCKLKYLIAKKDQIPRESPSGEKRLRIVGVTQSYEVYQSVKYQRAQVVKEILQDNPDYELG